MQMSPSTMARIHYPDLFMIKLCVDVASLISTKSPLPKLLEAYVSSRVLYMVEINIDHSVHLPLQLAILFYYFVLAMRHVDLIVFIFIFLLEIIECNVENTKKVNFVK